MNAELRRYAWLDLGLHRLVLGPLVLGALAIIVIATSKRPAEPLAWGALWLFVVVTAGWGALRALGSVAEEVRDRTWDFQRMAAVTPAELALGKVFGAPMYQWYLGAWCLLVLAAAGLRAGLPHLGAMLVGAVAAAVLLHALGVAISTAGARARLGDRTRRAGGLLLVLGLVQAAPLTALLHWGEAGSFVRWWGWRLDAPTFLAATLVAFAAWALLAAWRAMLRELQEPSRPWPWPAFALFAALWWGGVATPVVDRPGAGEVAAVFAGILALATYADALQEPLTRVSLARMARAWRGGAARWQPRLPAWLLHGSLALLGAALAWTLGAGETSKLPVVALPVALMAVRDAAIVGCFGVATRSARSPLGRAAFYIAVADLLVPAVAGAIGLQWFAKASLPLLWLGTQPALAAWGMGLHALVAVSLLAVLVARARRADPAG